MKIRATWKQIAGMLGALACGLVLPAAGEVRLPAIIGSGMVLQRDMTVPLWGWASPGEAITVRIADQVQTTTTGTNGEWRVTLEPLGTGGPLELVIEGSNTLRLQDVMVGEVWLCSGQSNMQWVLRNVSNAVDEVAAADFPRMRLFTVPNVVRDVPTNNLAGGWKTCTPEIAAGFSAVGYLFGRDLHKKLDVPIGLINSSWGGTPAESWTRRDILEADPDLQPIIARYGDSTSNYPARLAAYEAAVKAWEPQVYFADPGLSDEERAWAATNCDASAWTQAAQPQRLEQMGLSVDGIVWFRREVTIPADWAGRDLRLSLGTLDDFDQAWFNGTAVGATGPETDQHWTKARSYAIPGALVAAGRGVIAVRIMDRWLDGGFTGTKEQLTLARADGQGEALSLAGPWLYKLGVTRPQPAQYAQAPAKPMGPGNPHTPGGLYNGMIHPLIPFAIRGAIWYQGESNADRALQYGKLFPAMIRNWRADWNQGDFPFLFVQLANFMDPVTNCVQEAAWPELRDAQFKTLGKVPQTAMAVTIDVGEARDIHPRNKQAVGQRLAMAALGMVYDQDVPSSGPLYDGLVQESDRLVLTFTHVNGGLVAKGGELKGFAVAEADRRFVPAKAAIVDGVVVVWSDLIAHPVAARYNWANNPNGNLYNEAGLPASPFRTDDWPGTTDARR